MRPASDVAVIPSSRTAQQQSKLRALTRLGCLPHSHTSSASISRSPATIRARASRSIPCRKYALFLTNASPAAPRTASTKQLSPRIRSSPLRKIPSWAASLTCCHPPELHTSPPPVRSDRLPSSIPPERKATYLFRAMVWRLSKRCSTSFVAIHAD